MKTDVIVISNDGNNMETVLDQVDALATYKSLSPKNAMHLHLLAEETLAMMRAITGDVLFQPSPDAPTFTSGYVGGAPQMYGSYQWSMEDYREQLRQYREQNAEGSQEAWDELEKSVVSRVADDVKVSILGRTVEMTIVKRMA